MTGSAEAVPATIALRWWLRRGWSMGKGPELRIVEYLHPEDRRFLG
jgi:hypothetical protein